MKIMLISNEEDIFTDFRILLSLFNVFGFTSSKVEESNISRKYLVPKKWHYLIHVALKILTCMCGYCVLKTLPSFDANGILVSVLKEIMGVISFLSQIASCISNILYNTGHRKLWQQLYEIEKDLNISNIAINHKILRRIALACATFVMINPFFLIITLVFISIKFGEGTDKIIMFGQGLYYSYRSATLAFVICQYISSFSILREIFLKLGETAKSKFLTSEHPRTKDLLEIARFHQQCCGIARKANIVISLQLVVELMEVFGLLVITSFIYAVSLANRYDTYEDGVLYAGWVVFGIFRVVLLIVISHRCVASVSYLSCLLWERQCAYLMIIHRRRRSIKISCFA